MLQKNETPINRGAAERLTPLRPSCELVVADTLAKIDALRPAADFLHRQRGVLPPHPNTDIDRYLSLCDEAAQPCILLLQRDGRPEAMLFCRRQDVTVECRMGYFRLLQPSLRGLSVVYRGLLGPPTRETCHAFLGELQRRLRRGDCDIVELVHLPVDSEMYRTAHATADAWSRGHFPHVGLHGRLSVPRHIDLYYQSLSKKHRYNLKRSMRLLEASHRVTVTTYRRVDELDEVIHLAAQISLKTYQHKLGWGFFDNVNVRRRLLVMARRHWLRFHILRIDDQPCAFQWGFQYQRTYFPVQRGFDGDWKNGCIGTTLFLKVLEELCREGEVDSFDLSFGDEDYKQLLGETTQWPEATVYLFAPRWRPLCINLLSSVTRGLTVALVYVLRVLGLERRVKKSLRKLLQTA